MIIFCLLGKILEISVISTDPWIYFKENGEIYKINLAIKFP